jgi:hypothetical protein
VTSAAGRRRSLLTVLAAIALAGCDRSASDRQESLDSAAPCRALQEGFEQFAREHPEVPIAELRRQAEETCRSGANLAPGPRPTVSSSPGCDALPPEGVRRVALRRHTVQPPSRPVPFFAERAGALPPSGTPTVGGVQLPRGSRCLHHWATDEPVRDPARLAAHLASVFPQTGLWPVLWDFPDEGPDIYMFASGDPDAASRMDVERTLRAAWASYGPDEPFPGLARGSANGRRGAVAANPFGTLAQSWMTEGPPDFGWVVMLVPSNRPADVFSVLGPEQTEVMTDDALTSVLRSWEERFGTVVTTLGPGTLGLVVDAPPRTEGQALRLAAEQAAFAPEDGEQVFQPGGLDDLAARLRSGEPGDTLRSRNFWEFGWPD